MGAGPNPYGSKYPQPVGTDGKLADGAVPLWNFDWQDAMEQQALRTELGLNVSGGGNGFYPIYQMNEDGTYKLDSEGQRMYDFGSYRPSGSMANWNLPATLPNDKSERMKDEFSGRTFLEVTFIEGLKFKTSFNFDLINYNSLDYTNPKIGPAVNTGGSSSRENDRTFSWTWNNIPRRASFQSAGRTRSLFLPLRCAASIPFEHGIA